MLSGARASTLSSMLRTEPGFSPGMIRQTGVHCGVGATVDVGEAVADVITVAVGVAVAVGDTAVLVRVGGTTVKVGEGVAVAPPCMTPFDTSMSCWPFSRVSFQAT